MASKVVLPTERLIQLNESRDVHTLQSAETRYHIDTIRLQGRVTRMMSMLCRKPSSGRRYSEAETYD
jgi:hypothetical protein